jgi:Metallopeptidase toxin 3
MFPEDMGQYPFLLDLLHELKTLPVRRPTVFELFLEYSDLTRSKALAALKFGTRPWVVVESGPFSWGNYDWSNLARRAPTDTIALNSKFVNDFEVIGRWHKKWLDRHAPNRRWEEAVADAKLKVEAIVLHELVHWGDWTFDSATKDHLTPEKELGWAFLNAAYKPRKLRQELQAETIRDRVERWNQN